MAVYIFENTDANEAAGFQAGDTLVFSNTSVNARNVVVMPGNGLSTGVTLTANGQSLAFPAAALSDASQAGRIVFDDRSSLVLGTGGDDAGTDAITIAATPTGQIAANSVIYGLAGNDLITAVEGNDYLYGGVGDDTLNGGDGNDHLYGNALTSAQGAEDGNDVINGGNGADYIQGNAGADTLNGGDGSDRIFGGAGGDTINGGEGQDQINGNAGNDTINGDNGNDILRGGQGNDLLFGGEGNDILYGDLGADTLTGGNGLDVLFGGDGADVFSFAAGDSAPVTSATGTGSLTDVIVDYVDGTDKIDFASVTAAAGSTPAVTAQVLLDQSGSTFGTVLAAQQYAQSLINANAAATNTVEVVALNVGGDAYLFTTQGSSATAIDTVIKVQGVSASVFNSTDFV